MTKLMWDAVGQRFYETGVDHGVLYIPNSSGVYDNGYAWNGLVSVTESPSGAEASPQYADNIKYLNLVSAEEFGATIEAFTYPEEFGQCDGTATPTAGVSFGQQARKLFGLSYRTIVGNDTDGTDYGYKLHLIYGALAAPSEKAYNTINDSPEAITFSWEVTTTPVGAGDDFKPTAQLTVDSTLVDPDALTTLENILYGTPGSDPRLPLPEEVVALFAGTVTTVTPGVPTFNSSTDVITIPATTGVIYRVNGSVVPSGATDPIEDPVVVSAIPASGYKFPEVVADEWFFSPA